MSLLSLALGFFVPAIIAGALGARGVAGISMDIAKWLVMIFIILAVISLILQQHPANPFLGYVPDL